MSFKVVPFEFVLNVRRRPSRAQEVPKRLGDYCAHVSVHVRLNFVSYTVRTMLTF